MGAQGVKGMVLKSRFTKEVCLTSAAYITESNAYSFAITYPALNVYTFGTLTSILSSSLHQNSSKKD